MTRTAVGFGPRLVVDRNGASALRGCSCGRIAEHRTTRRADRRAGSDYRARARAARRLAIDAGVFRRRNDRTRVAARDDPYEVMRRRRRRSFEDGAVVMRPSAMSRRAEADRMQAEFARARRSARRTYCQSRIARRQRRDCSQARPPSSASAVAATNSAAAGFARLARRTAIAPSRSRLAPDVPALRSSRPPSPSDTIVIGADKADAGRVCGFQDDRAGTR